ncbi:pyridoxal phosphate-dependent aminotransferase [archaeon]|nr:pyridoxal phosphate-dependent aminotransferase [archaeon]
MPHIAERTRQIKRSPIRKIAELLARAAGRPTIISFGGGAPGIPPPKELMEKARELVTNWPPYKYTATRGVPSLLSALSDYIKRYTGQEYDPKKEITVTEGGTEGILLALMALVDPGDEVILMNPTYVGYWQPIKLCGGIIRDIPVYVEEGFQPNPERIKEAISERTKLLILLTPDNPTSRIVKREIAQAIIDLANDHDFWVLYDDIYGHMVYEGENVWVSGLPGARERVVTVSSFSKMASIPGLRLGFAYGPEEVIAAMEKVKQYVTLCSSTFSQLLAEYFLTTGVLEKYIREVVVPTYKRQRDAMYEALTELLPEARTVKAPASFYHFVNVQPYLERLGMNDEEFSERLFHEKEVVVIPGMYFGSRGENHIRLTFVSEPPERIREGLKRIAEFLRERGAL